MPVILTAKNGMDPEDAVRKFIQDTLPTSSPTKMIAAGNKEIANIKARTAQGLDVDGQPFAPYTPAYAKQRAKLGLSTSPVDLRRTGELLDSMTVEVTGPREFAIVVTDLSSNVYGPPNNARRRYFDSNEAELNEMMTELLDKDEA